MIMEMRKRMRKYGGEDGKGSIRRGMNQRVHLMKELNLERGRNRETYHILVVVVRRGRCEVESD
jgi:hypothetical protein